MISTAIILVSIGIYFGLNRQLSSPLQKISNFEECVRAGYPVGESYPRQCWTPDGRSFVEKIKQDSLLTPTLGPITIEGEMTCLPKTGQGAQTLECLMGLKGIDGRHYGLKNLSKLDPTYKLSRDGLKVLVTGTFRPDELRGPDGNKYDVVGVIEVTSIKEIMN